MRLSVRCSRQELAEIDARAAALRVRRRDYALAVFRDEAARGGELLRRLAQGAPRPAPGRRRGAARTVNATFRLPPEDAAALAARAAALGLSRPAYALWALRAERWRGGDLALRA